MKSARGGDVPGTESHFNKNMPKTLFLQTDRGTGAGSELTPTIPSTHLITTMTQRSGQPAS